MPFDAPLADARALDVCRASDHRVGTAAHTRRRASVLAAVAAAALTLAPLANPSVIAGAQTFSAGFAPGCDPAAGCTTAQFLITLTSGELSLNTLSLTFTGGPYRFTPTVDGSTTGTFVAQDDLGPFGGFTTISGSGSQLFIDFLDTGDPVNPGFPLTLSAGAAGWLEVDVTPDAGGAPFAFAYVGELTGGGTVSGRVGPTSVVPEPGTVLLVASGLIALGGWGRMRRRAAT